MYVFRRVCRRISLARNINYQNTFLSDEHRLFKFQPQQSGWFMVLYTYGADDDNPIRHTPTVYVYTYYYSTFVWKFRTIAQHYYYWFRIPHQWITAQGPCSPSHHPPGATGFACVSIFRKHFRPYDSLGNWKAPDEHNQDESTLYISDPPEGCTV